MFVENATYKQRGNAYLGVEVKIKKAENSKFIVAKDKANVVIRIVKNALVFTVQDARNSKSFGIEIEQSKFLEPILTTMRFLRHTDGDLSTSFDLIDET